MLQLCPRTISRRARLVGINPVDPVEASEDDAVGVVGEEPLLAECGPERLFNRTGTLVVQVEQLSDVAAARGDYNRLFPSVRSGIDGASTFKPR